MHLAPCPKPDPDLMLPLQQHPAYALALGQSPAPVQVIDKDGPLAYALILRGPLRARTILRGPIWLHDLTQHQKTQALCTLAPRLIEAETPDAAHHAAGFRAVTTPVFVAEWSLDRAKDARWNTMHGKWRNALRASLAAPLHIRHRALATGTDHPIFAHSRAHARAQGYTAASARIAHGFAKAVPKSTRIFTASHGRDAVAHMLFIHQGPVVTYFIGWTNDMGRTHRAHHRILEEAAQFYAARGVRRMDLGTLDTQSAPGLARFKIGTGAVVRPLGGSLLRLGPLLPWALATDQTER